jgi:hypothetical protein
LREAGIHYTPPDTEKFPRGSTQVFVVVEAQVVENFDRFTEGNLKEKKWLI